MVGISIDGVMMEGVVPISLQPGESAEVSFEMMFMAAGAKHICVGVVQGNQLV
jgi:hypothetical protein